MGERLAQLVGRLQGYPLWQVALEFALIWLLVYGAVRFMQGTRGASALKGLVVVLVFAALVVRVVGQRDSFQRLTYLYQNFLPLAFFSLIVIFQAELKRGLTRLGERQLFRRAGVGVAPVVDSIVEASVYLSKARFGGLIVIERDNSLRGLIEGGETVDAKVSARLLKTIFFPGSDLHDLAVVISGNEIKAAGVQLPLAHADEMPDETLGSRHRAAVGISKESDALVVVVSEETGAMSVAERGRLERGLSADELKELLIKRLSRGESSWTSENEPDRADAGESGGESGEPGEPRAPRAAGGAGASKSLPRRTKEPASRG
ncbi:MAG: diadenylate cyclase CdaA [Phycisphaerales bacterium]